MEKKKNPQDFVSKASGKRRGIIGEVVGLLKHNKKWWLIPIIFTILILGMLVILGGTAAAPFIYTLF